MKKFLTILLILSLAISFYFYKQNQSLRRKLIDKGEKISENDKYVEMLTEKIELLTNMATKKTKEEELENLLEKIEKKEIKKDFKNPNTPDLMPLAGKFKKSQDYHAKHPGIDYATKEGTKVLCSAAGEVLSVYEDEHYGNVIIVDHFNKYATLYAHLQKSLVETGQSVKKGETIALSGNTGNSTAPHLHFEVMINGENINPESILK